MLFNIEVSDSVFNKFSYLISSLFFLFYKGSNNLANFFNLLLLGKAEDSLLNSFVAFFNII